CRGLPSSSPGPARRAGGRTAIVRLGWVALAVGAVATGRSSSPSFDISITGKTAKATPSLRFSIRSRVVFWVEASVVYRQATPKGGLFLAPDLGMAVTLPGLGGNVAVSSLSGS